jgi:hypothetical protein
MGMIYKNTYKDKKTGGISVFAKSVHFKLGGLETHDRV